MTIEEFWNRALLAALMRLPVEQAKAEADAATDLCIHQWQSNIYRDAPSRPARWQDQKIGSVPRIWPAERLAATPNPDLDPPSAAEDQQAS